MCTWKEIDVLQQQILVSVTKIPEGLPLPVIKSTHMCFVMWVIPGIAMLKEIVGYEKAGMGANANGPFETVMFHLMVNVYMESYDRPALVQMRTAPLKQSYFI